MEFDASDSLSARKRQKVDEPGVNNANSAKKDWHGVSRNTTGDSTYGGKGANPAFARRDSYNKDEHTGSSGFSYPTDHAYDRSDRNRSSYGRDYPNYAGENAGWKQQRASSWYDDYPSAGTAYGASTSWNADSRYRDYPTHDTDPYASSSSAYYRSSSGKGDGYGYDGYYRSSSAERGDAYQGDRSAVVPSSSSHAYYGADGYSAARYDYPQDGYGTRYDSQAYGADTTGGAGRFGKGGRFGFSSAYRTDNAANSTAAGGRYANTFKARQYSFGNKKVNKARQTTAGSPNKRRGAANKDGEEAQQEQKEPEKPKIIDDLAVKEYLTLRSTLLDYHLTMALLKLNLKPDLDMRKTLLDQKMAEAGIYVPPVEAVPETTSAAAAAATTGAAASAMPAPMQLSRVNSVEVAKPKPVAGGANLTRAESAGPGALKRDVSGVKRQNTWNVVVPASNWDADTMSVSSAMSGKEETKSEYGSASKPGFSTRQQGRDGYPLQSELSAYGPAGAAPESQPDSAWKPSVRSRDKSAVYGAESNPAAGALADGERDVRAPSRERSAPRSRSHSRVPPAAYSRESSAPYAGRDSRERMAARGHSRDTRDARDTRDTRYARDAYDYPSYDYNAAYPAADRYPDDRYGYDSYAYGGYDDRGYGAAAYPTYDRYDQYAQQGRADTRDRADYGYDARGAYSAPASHATGRYGDRRDAPGAGGDGGHVRGRSSARAEGLARQGSAGSVHSHRSRSRSPHGGPAVDSGRPPRALGVDSGVKADREAGRDVLAAPVRANSNNRGSIAHSTSSDHLQGSTDNNVTAAVSAQRAVSPAQEREPGESSPISTPEAPQGKRLHREVILAKPHGQPGFNKGYGKYEFSGGGAQGNVGKQGQFSHQGQNQGNYGQGQQGHYGYQGGQQSAQQGGPPFNKHQNKFHKNNNGGPAQHQQGGQARPKPSPKKSAVPAATSPAPAAAAGVVSEVAPLKTPR